MFAYAYEYPIAYQIIVTDGTEQNTFEYEFTKDQAVEASVNEAVLLAELAVAQKQPPTPIIL